MDEDEGPLLSPIPVNYADCDWAYLKRERKSILTQLLITERGSVLFVGEGDFSFTLAFAALREFVKRGYHGRGILEEYQRHLVEFPLQETSVWENITATRYEPLCPQAKHNCASIPIACKPEADLSEVKLQCISSAADYTLKRHRDALKQQQQQQQQQQKQKQCLQQRQEIQKQQKQQLWQQLKQKVWQQEQVLLQQAHKDQDEQQQLRHCKQDNEQKKVESKLLQQGKELHMKFQFIKQLPGIPAILYGIDALTIPARLTSGAAVIWFQCPWIPRHPATPGCNTRKLVSRFLLNLARADQIKQDAYVCIGITKLFPYIKHYGLEGLLDKGLGDKPAWQHTILEQYKFVGVDDELVKEVLSFGYHHQTVREDNDIHDILIDHHVTLIFQRNKDCEK